MTDVNWTNKAISKAMLNKAFKVEAIPWGTKVISFRLVTLVASVKKLNSDLIVNVWKRTEMDQERDELEWRYEDTF